MERGVSCDQVGKTKDLTHGERNSTMRFISMRMEGAGTYSDVLVNLDLVQCITIDTPQLSVVYFGPEDTIKVFGSLEDIKERIPE